MPQINPATLAESLTPALARVLTAPPRTWHPTRTVRRLQRLGIIGMVYGPVDGKTQITHSELTDLGREVLEIVNA